MAIQFVPETGAGVTDANTYNALAALTQFAANKGDEFADSWSNLDPDVQKAAAIAATQYMQGRWGGQWKGYRTTSEQALDWPRLYVTDDRGVALDEHTLPKEVLQAHAEYTFEQALGTGLFVSPTLDESGRPLKSISERVDVIETSRTFVDLPTVQPYRELPIADLLLKRWTVQGSSKYLLRV